MNTFIYAIENVLTEEERKKILTDSKKYLLKIDDTFPGKQTDSLKPYPEFNWVEERMIKAATKVIGRVRVNRFWVNWTNGNKKDIGWHNHIDHYPTDYASVYYLKSIPFFDGTLFEDQFIKAPQNSLLIFPSHLFHTAPSSFRYNPFRMDRYTMSLDFSKIKFDA